MTSDLVEQWSGLWRPQDRLPLSQWAEKNFHLSSDYSATTGTIQLYGWQREIFDSFTDPRIQKIVLKVGTQLVKTLFIQASLAYVIAEVPGPVLLSQPKDPDAETFSKERLGPMIRDNPILRGRIEDKKGPLNTITYKQFPGGSLTLVGAMVPGNAARRTIQYFFADEVNKYPRSVGDEGSFLRLAEERVFRFGTRAKLIYTCSPTTPDAPISRQYETSDQRRPWAACYDCGHLQVLRWGQVWWSKEVALEDRPETAQYLCEKCEARWNDVQRWKAADLATWKNDKPFRGTAGFWISHLYSPKKLSKMVRNWMEIDTSGDVNELKVFINTNLAEDWVDRGESPDWKLLYERAQGEPNGVVPRGGLFLTASVDVQDKRLEVEVKAWGRGKENWSVFYAVIELRQKDSLGREFVCSTADSGYWSQDSQLAEILGRDWPVEGGGTLRVMACGIDTGHNAEPVYDFCRRFPQPAYGPAGAAIHAYGTVIPIKGGHSWDKIIEGFSSVDAAQKREGLRIVTVGSSALKSEAYSLFHSQRPPIGDEPFSPGYCHFPRYEAAYFQGLCAESRVTTASGKQEWRKDHPRNEPLDLHGYNRAMAELCGVSRFGDEEWIELESRITGSQQPATLPNVPKRNKPSDNDYWGSGRGEWFK
jgi:phage terminase large subunit GpA-like protein